MGPLLLLNGPNLNLLGTREEHLYGAEALKKIEGRVQHKAKKLGYELICLQSNHEGVLIDAIQKEGSKSVGVIINPGGFGHSSVAIRDALIAINRPVVEVHITNLAKRESFRQHTLISDISIGYIAGFGSIGYELACDALNDHLRSRSS